MRANHEGTRESVTFDETDPAPNAGPLLPAAVRAQRLDLAGLVDRRLHLVRQGAPSSTEALPVVGSMLTGGDSRDGVAVLRVGTARSSFDGTRAPSTVGSCLPAHEWCAVQQLDAIGATAHGLSGAACD